MVERLRVDDATPSAVVQKLQPLEAHRPFHDLNRTDCLLMGLIDEVRVPSDWNRFPKNAPTRVAGVWTATGPVVRWRSGDAIPDSHDHLLFRDDDLNSAVQGYVSVTDDQVIVEGSSDVSAVPDLPPLDAAQSEFRNWFRHNGVLMVAAGVISLFVVILGSTAYFSLEDEGRADVLAHMAKLAFQLLAIVIAGALVKLAIDNSKEYRERKQRLTDDQTSYTRRIIDVSHKLDIARLQILANRSVKTWSHEINHLVDAYVDLRDLQHDVLTTQRSPDPLFVDWDMIRPKLDVMVAYLGALIDEYSENKKKLSEQQREAEDTNHSPEDRQVRQQEVWQGLRGLARLGDLVGAHPTGGYADFRRSYRSALALMRANLGGRRARRGTQDDATSQPGITGPQD